MGFIGSTETGRKVAEAAAGKAAVLELGGNGPVVVLDDADLELAAEAAVTACFMCAGQSCTAGERLLVHRAVREEFVARLAQLVAERVVLGDPFAETTTMGPLNNAGVAEKMDEHVGDAVRRGATVIAGGERQQGFPTDLYWQPTVLDGVPADSLVAQEETFGPIAPVVDDRLARRGDLARERVAVRAPLGDLHARSRPGAALRRRGAHRLGEHQRLVELLGVAPPVRRACRHGERHRAGRRQRADGVVHGAADDRRRVTYDYVIVGGGSAGCALAARLTEDPATRVLVLEAGRTDSWWDLYIHMPAALSFPIGNRFYDWKYESEPEPFMNGRRIYHARGQGARRVELDQRDDLPARQPAGLRALGARTSWDYAHCLPYFKRMETCLAGADEWRGGDGPLLLERGPAEGPLFGAFLAAVQEAGYELTDDVNGYRQEGFARFDRNIHRGRRVERCARVPAPGDVAARTSRCGRARSSSGSSSTARARSACRSSGETIRAGEVILCGGAINSPQLLQLSGVGNAAELGALGDRRRARPAGRRREPAGPPRGLRAVLVEAAGDGRARATSGATGRSSGLKWLLFKSGPGATNHFEAGGFVRSNDEVAYPNVMFHFLPIAVRYDGTAPRGHGYQLHVGPMYSDARGSVKITSTDPRVHPALRFNYLSTDQDRREWVECVRAARSILGQPAFEPFNGGELSPGAEVETDERDPRLGAPRRRDGAAPVVHVRDGRRSCRPGDDARLRPRRSSRRRRERVPVRHEREHLRAGDDGRREGRRSDPRPDAAPCRPTPSSTAMTLSRAPSR